MSKSASRVGSALPPPTEPTQKIKLDRKPPRSQRAASAFGGVRKPERNIKSICENSNNF